MTSTSKHVVRAGLLFALALAAGCKESAPSATADAGAPLATTAPSAVASATASATPAASPFVVPNTVIAQHVLIAYKGAKRAPNGVTRSKAEAKKRAEEVAAKAKEPGADFSALVAEYSDDPAAKERQGSVGKFTRDKMDKHFSDAAFALREGEVSAPVETPFGFHVIKRNQ
jgi:hypothetical protein